MSRNYTKFSHVEKKLVKFLIQSFKENFTNSWQHAWQFSKLYFQCNHQSSLTIASGWRQSFVEVSVPVSAQRISLLRQS